MTFWRLIIGFEGLLMILILIAFFILCERKVLGYIQIRKGPNKVGLAGLMQRFSDFIKLMVKAKVTDYTVHRWFCWFGCFILLVCSVICSYLYRFIKSSIYYKFCLLYFLVLSTFIGYGWLMLGFGSWKKYSLIRAVRVSFASVRFEAVFMCVLLIYGLLNKDYGNRVVSYMFFVVPLCYFTWLTSLIRESSRIPFDYGEAEGELVSGLKTEYRGIPFITIFACEYLMMFIFSWLSSFIFFGRLSLFILFHLFLFIWLRGTFPRVRYDFYVDIIWKVGLIILFLYLISCFGY